MKTALLITSLLALCVSTVGCKTTTAAESDVKDLVPAATSGVTVHINLHSICGNPIDDARAKVAEPGLKRCFETYDPQHLGRVAYVPAGKVMTIEALAQEISEPACKEQLDAGSPNGTAQNWITCEIDGAAEPAKYAFADLTKKTSQIPDAQVYNTASFACAGAGHINNPLKSCEVRGFTSTGKPLRYIELAGESDGTCELQGRLAKVIFDQGLDTRTMICSFKQ